MNANPHNLTDLQAGAALAYVGEAAGNLTKACELAGYGNAVAAAKSLSKHERFWVYVEELREELGHYHDALSPREIHSLWAEIARSKSCETRDRLAALKAAAEAHGMFNHRAKMDLELSFKVIVPSPLGSAARRELEEIEEAELLDEDSQAEPEAIEYVERIQPLRSWNDNRD